MVKINTESGTLEVDGKRFVIVPEADWHEVQSRVMLPALPPKHSDGTYPAVEAVRVLMARSIILDREKVGLTQKALAEQAGIRVETLNRIETCKVSASTATIAKIEAALERARETGRKKARRKAK